MRKIISMLAFIGILSSNVVNLYAAVGATADHFVVTASPTSTKVGEAIDLTVKAVDASGNVVKNYAGMIYISSDTDTKATVPYSDGYQFVPADLGAKTFSKGLSFTKEGKMKIVVLDLENENLEGSTEITVGSGESTATGTTSDITISSPDNGMTTSNSEVTVSGTAKKNSKIKYILNTKEVGTNQSDDSGNFTYNMTNLATGDNVIEVKVVDGTDKVISTSDKIVVKLDVTGPVLKNIVVKEGKEVPAGSSVTVEITSDASLSEVSASVGDFNQVLKETSTPGVYSGSLTIPSEPGDYSVNVTLKNALGKTTTRNNALSIKATESNIFKDVKSFIGDKKVSFTFDLKQNSDTIAKFKFKYSTGTELDKELITFDKDKIKNASGSYAWYVAGLDMAKYNFQIVPLDKDSKELSGKSDVMEIDLSLNSGSNKCMISNIAGLKVTKAGDVSELSWDATLEATSYNVYKKGEDGNFSLIENVKTNKYTINISPDKVKYEEFAVKGVCGDGENQNESADYSNVTKVQTGPAQIIALILLSLTGAYFYTRRRKFN
ncbi:hypothetical protein M0P65_04195 [Candidatus Gracilibacteria bacterium]|nr:hypothetical protein [Candidatus Gracilibacteria bacterium]